MKKPHVEFVFNVSRLAFCARNCFCLNCWQYTAQTEQTWQEKDCWCLPSQGRRVLWDFFFIEESARYSAGHREKWLTNFANTWYENPSHLLIHEKHDRYSIPIGQRWKFQYCRENLGDYPGSQIFLLLENTAAFWGLWWS